MLTVEKEGRLKGVLLLQTACWPVEKERRLKGVLLLLTAC